MNEIFTYTVEKEHLEVLMQDVSFSGKIVEDNLQVIIGEESVDSELNTDRLLVKIYESLFDTSIKEDFLEVKVKEVISLSPIDIPKNTTLLTVLQSIQSGYEFFVNSGGTYYLQEGDIGNLLSSEQEFNSNEKIQFFLNGNNLVKGNHVRWSSQFSFTFNFNVDPDDFIKVIS